MKEEQESQQEGEGVVGIPQMDNDEFLQIGIESRSSSPMSKIREEPSLLAQSVCCTSCGVPPEEVLSFFNCQKFKSFCFLKVKDRKEELFFGMHFILLFVVYPIVNMKTLGYSFMNL